MEEEHTNLARKLIELGADVNAGDKAGHTALSRAVQNGELTLVLRIYCSKLSVLMFYEGRELVEKGANVNAVTSDGPIFSLACAAGNLEMAKFLLEVRRPSDEFHLNVHSHCL